MTQTDETSSASSNSTAPSVFTKRQLQANLNHFATVAVACGILMWSVFNIWLNVLAYRAETQEDRAWGIAWLIVLVCCAMPLLYGLKMLFKSLGKKA